MITIFYAISKKKWIIKRISKILMASITRRLLTEEEYRQEGQEYTNRSLKELINFCQNSPKDYSWKIVSRLSNAQK